MVMGRYHLSERTLSSSTNTCCFPSSNYLNFESQVACGTSYYVDKRIHKILSLPPYLSRRGIHLTGIATHRKDRSVSGVRAFLTFYITRPAVVMVCYDSRLQHLPVWLLYFRKTPHKVETTEVYICARQTRTILVGLGWVGSVWVARSIFFSLL